MTQPALSPATLQTFRLEEWDRQSWQKAALELTYADPRDLCAWRAFVEASTAIAQTHLPLEGALVLGDFFQPDGPDALLIENLPVDPTLPRAPSDGRRPACKTAVSEAVIAGLIESHAAIVSY